MFWLLHDYRDKAVGVQNIIKNVTKAIDMTIKAQKKATDAIQQAEDDTNIAAEIIKKVRENDINTNRENPNNNAINPYIFSI